MQTSQEDSGPDASVHPGGPLVTPRSDFFASFAWIAVGIAIAVGSWQMDRLENQDVQPYAVPGLLPFFLGLAIVFFGGLMLVRAWTSGALAPHARRAAGMSPAERKQFLIVLGLCLAFGIGLVGHGLPFWLAAAVFVAITIFVLQYPQRRAADEIKRGLILAIVIGVCAGLGVTLVFQEFFLVRLP
ncbi:MAG: tripartite tricarboxylate transporter TctB family protein [Rhodoplanes sp.]|uniref:tripartite tricarboxylate transporter TctB family protein n=1 Tax=Rhodoplanes sp. TaxID=1968906 RepID=UPI00183F4355|nr:tripartite tricarboxylate transporter TctB family protein [Rhodoplanes sp.]NVO15226.1 tripartite tricarboxylate transporter TctB family protein [Rhodoplanes sp.]